MLEAVLDFVFPRRCAGCGMTGTWLCRACSAAASPAPRSRCRRCGRLTSVVPCPLCDSRGAPDLLVAACRLEGPIREAVHRLKYGDRPQLAEALARVAWSLVDDLAAGVLVPVPVHPRRLRRRGYNQAELVAREISARLGRPVWPGLRRVLDTPSQVGRGGASRRRALAGAFEAVGPAPATVVLIDDVVTTGATMIAAAAALRDAGAVTVGAIAVTLG